VSAFVQRAGRAARASNRTGIAVLLVEKSAYDADLNKVFQDQNFKLKSNKKSTVRQSSNYEKSKTKVYAIQRGVLRGSYGGLSDHITPDIIVHLDKISIDEGLYSFVQSTTCRRKVLTEIYDNKIPSKHHTTA
jgi:superfamily II DNA/RNA helicase